MQIVSINTGLAKPFFHNDRAGTKRIISAYKKNAVSTLLNPCEVFVNLLGLEGDEQADQKVHGGHDKAVYAYPLEHYSFWSDLIARETLQETHFEHGAFAENLTVQGFEESQVWIGDLWFVGDVELSVVGLREPCFKFNASMKFRGAAKAMIQSAKSGWYLRVRSPGIIKAGDSIKVAPGPRKISIHQQNFVLQRNANSSKYLFDE